MKLVHQSESINYIERSSPMAQTIPCDDSPTTVIIRKPELMNLQTAREDALPTAIRLRDQWGLFVADRTEFGIRSKSGVKPPHSIKTCRKTRMSSKTRQPLECCGSTQLWTGMGRWTNRIRLNRNGSELHPPIYSCASMDRTTNIRSNSTSGVSNS